MIASKSDSILYVWPSNWATDTDEKQHSHICNMALGGELHRAPLKSGVNKILDLGTGTGAWAIDIAEYGLH